MFWVRQAIEASKELCSVHKERLRACQKELHVKTIEGLSIQNELRDSLEIAESKLETAQIDVVRNREGLFLTCIIRASWSYSFRTLCPCRLFCFLLYLVVNTVWCSCVTCVSWCIQPISIRARRCWCRPVVNLTHPLSGAITVAYGVKVGTLKDAAVVRKSVFCLFVRKLS